MRSLRFPSKFQPAFDQWNGICSEMNKNLSIVPSVGVYTLLQPRPRSSVISSFQGRNPVLQRTVDDRSRPSWSIPTALSSDTLQFSSHLPSSGLRPRPHSTRSLAVILDPVPQVFRVFEEITQAGAHGIAKIWRSPIDRCCADFCSNPIRSRQDVSAQSTDLSTSDSMAQSPPNGLYVAQQIVGFRYVGLIIDSYIWCRAR